MDKQKIIIYTDGGARGNPGPAACGYVIAGDAYGEFLGELLTNNEAEYRGVIEAFKKIISLRGESVLKKLAIEVKMDSELLVKQFNGEYRVKQEHLKLLYAEAENLREKFGSVKFIHIPRAENALADKMVNEVLDKRETKNRR